MSDYGDVEGTEAQRNPLFQSIKSQISDKSMGGADLSDVEWAALGGVVLWAALAGELGVLRDLVDAHDSHKPSGRLADYADYDKRTALHLAAAGGQEGVVKFLLEEARVRANPVDRWGYSPLDDAERFAKRTGRWGAFRLLAQEYHGRPGPGNEETSMIKAAFHGDHETVERLAESRHVQGKDVNPPDYDDRTALHLAASMGNYRVVQSMLGQGVGASPDCKDRWNRRPVDDAQDGLNRAKRLKDNEKIDNFQKCIALLQKSGTPPYGTGATPRCMLCGNVKPTYHDVSYKDDGDEMVSGHVLQKPGEETTMTGKDKLDFNGTPAAGSLFCQTL